jgi:hypothetical protein
MRSAARLPSDFEGGRTTKERRGTTSATPVIAGMETKVAQFTTVFLFNILTNREEGAKRVN